MHSLSYTKTAKTHYSILDTKSPGLQKPEFFDLLAL
jgi:hypothetical protein